MKTGWRKLRLAALIGVCLSLTACAGTILGTAADVAIEAAKIPFKVTGAIIDVATGGEEDED